MSVSAALESEFHDDIIYPDAIPFVLVHLACLSAFWTGVSWGMVGLCVALYAVRMFAVTGGYHRYFSHRSFKTSRIVQFVFAFAAQSTTQKSVLWWAALHRHHHKYSDTEFDVHSPRQRGFWYSHVGWIFDSRHEATALEDVPDLAKYPELLFLHRFEQLPAVVLALACLVAFGWEGLVVGFFWSTVLLYHGTFFINSLAHVHGSRRYATGDDSRNNWWLAILTMGEGWHNNHHAYQRSCRQGFRWYEYDATYYALQAMAWVGLVRDLGTPPPDVVRNERALGRATIERIARQLAAHVDREALDAYLTRLPSLPHFPTRRDLESKLPHIPTWAELEARLPHWPTMAELEARLPHLPSVEELRERARRMIPETPSMDDIVVRAREVIAQARLAAGAGATTPA